MLKRFGMLAIALLALSVASNQAKAEDIYQTEELFDLNSIIVDGEMYIWNRISDILDLVRGGLAGGPGIGAEIAITNYAQLGAYANVERGVTFPHFVFPLWIVDYYERNEPVFKEHIGSYATAAFGPWRAENRTDKAALDYYFPRDRWDIRVQIDAAIIHAYLAVSPLEFWDLLAGFVGLDPSGDDMHTDRMVSRKPASQFGRGLCNLVFGILEIPKTVLIVTDAEGDLPGISTGLAIGVWRFLCREVVGAVELITFPFGWNSIIEPEFVFSNDMSTTWRVRKPDFQKNSATRNTRN